MRNKHFNFTVHMKNGDTHNFQHMTLNQFGNAARDINVVDVENIEKEISIIPTNHTKSANLLNFIMGKRV